MDIKQRFVRNLRAEMKRQGYSQCKLATKLDMFPQQFARYYHGKTTPGLDMLDKIAAALNVHPSKLVKE